MRIYQGESQSSDTTFTDQLGCCLLVSLMDIPRLPASYSWRVPVGHDPFLFPTAAKAGFNLKPGNPTNSSA